MAQIRIHTAGILAIALDLFAHAPALAASLQKVNNWGASGVPATVSMYLYVPDKLATKPPVLVLAHFCGGTASAVFGQAQGVVKAADQYGFIIVVPQAANQDGSGRCWDVGSTKALTRDGGGDTQAIAQMVKYALTTYTANADRVYVTGDSSGGMMTQALLALYPDVFKAGSEFAGVPAGCWAAGNPSGSWSGQCAGGQVTHTAQEWGDMVRSMYPGYTGHRPRVQLVHGDADDTIKYKNHTEAIKQWTNVLGLSATPSSTESVTLGSHQATREKWLNSCGYVVLDALTSKGGDHGPSDALFEASYVVPFLGLDKTDATDPEVAKCGAGGMGGGAGTGGAHAGGAGGGASGGATSGGGMTGGQLGAGGSIGGMSGTGGSTSGGNVATGGRNTATGGMSGTGAAGGGAGGASSEKGGGSPATAAGGMPPASAGLGSTASGGSKASGSSGTAGASAPSPPQDDSGCSCTVAGGATAPRGLLALAFGAVLALRRRRLRSGGMS